MSRLAKKPIEIPEKVTITIADSIITAKGPKGEMKQAIHPLVSIEQKDNTLEIKVKDEKDKFNASLWGTFGSLVRNLLIGVTDGFTKELEINGVGYTWEMQGKKLIVKAGYSHPVEYEFPEGIEAKAEKNTLSITGIDKQLVGSVAAEIRKIRKPEPYKGKGIKYKDEHIRRKAGKQSTGGGSSGS